jgi:repressor of nif and glnA expression
MNFKEIVAKAWEEVYGNDSAELNDVIDNIKEIINNILSYNKKSTVNRVLERMGYDYSISYIRYFLEEIDEDILDIMNSYKTKEIDEDEARNQLIELFSKVKEIETLVGDLEEELFVEEEFEEEYDDYEDYDDF